MSVTSKSTDLVKLNDKKPKLPIKFKPSQVNQALELVDKNLKIEQKLKNIYQIF